MAASAWQNSPGELPTLVVHHGPADPVGYRSGGENRNTVRFAPDGDETAGGALAITVITFDAQAKRILDADIVLNGDYDFGFFPEEDASQATNKYDLQNVLTHELGHLLGLGEDLTDESATMYAFSQPGETGKRDLEARDLSSIAELYSEPFDFATSGGCGGATIAGYSGQSWIWVALGLAFIGLGMRRRSTRRWLAGASGAGALTLALSSASIDGALLGDVGCDIAASPSSSFTVVGSTAAWQDGLIVTELSLRTAAGGSLQARALGGQVGDLVQVVGRALPPEPGQTLQLESRLDDSSGSLWLAPLHVAD